jgi:hypothetical protein
VERPLGVVLVGDGRSEESHDAVAGELIDGALVAVDRLREALEAAVHHHVEVFGRYLAGD